MNPHEDPDATWKAGPPGRRFLAGVVFVVLVAGAVLWMGGIPPIVRRLSGNSGTADWGSPPAASAAVAAAADQLRTACRAGDYARSGHEAWQTLVRRAAAARLTSNLCHCATEAVTPWLRGAADTAAGLDAAEARRQLLDALANDDVLSRIKDCIEPSLLIREPRD